MNDRAYAAHLAALSEDEFTRELGLARGAADNAVPGSEARLIAAEYESRRRHGPDCGLMT